MKAKEKEHDLKLEKEKKGASALWMKIHLRSDSSFLFCEKCSKKREKNSA